MELIQSLGTRRKPSKSRSAGRVRGWGLFHCPECNNLVDKPTNDGVNAKTCGCIRRSLRHNDRGSKIYRTWTKMNERCNDKNNKRYHRYGGRGIKVCGEWILYKKFREWALDNGYSDKLEIDRIDNDGGYSPSNCRFVTTAQNCRNRPSTKLTWAVVNIIRAMYGSGEISLRKLGNLFGVDRGTIHAVVQYKTWNL